MKCRPLLRTILPACWIVLGGCTGAMAGSEAEPVSAPAVGVEGMTDSNVAPRSSEPGASEHGVAEVWGDYVSAGLERESLTDSRVLKAMSRVPRHRFVPEEIQPAAYQDRALSIGQGQTISQPYIVALMTQEANVSRGAKVLEVGTGSGYQAAVLSELGADVYSVELLPELAEEAAARLKFLGFDRVHVRAGDGYAGWQEAGPFDAILVTAAAPQIPPALIQQLANRGRLVIPVEEKSGAERLLVIEREGNNLLTRDLGSVKFVPMLGEVRSENPAAQAPRLQTPANQTPVDPTNTNASGTNPPASTSRGQLSSDAKPDVENVATKSELESLIGTKPPRDTN